MTGNGLKRSGFILLQRQFIRYNLLYIPENALDLFVC